MIKRFLKWKKAAPITSDVGTKIPQRRISEAMPWAQDAQSNQQRLELASERTFQQPLPRPKASEGVAMDDACFTAPLKGGLQSAFNGTSLPASLVSWYATQGFIGYQLSATIAQHWLVSKCCLMPAKDATRNGYEITVNDGTKVSTEILDALRKYDVAYKINKNLIELVQMGRIFGIRVAMFVVDAEDPDEYYKNPFNPDSVMPGTYRGISQIDPYWVIPQMDIHAAANPGDINFYEPTWWIVNGRQIHRSHLIIFRTEEVADILKPTYIYGGIPIPQKIYERVYGAERLASEAPLLALSKRTTVIKTDTAMAAAKPEVLLDSIQQFAYYRDNFGVKLLGLDEEMEQFDTSLTDLDVNIMTQYQIVAAAANVPAVKLLGTTPKGFNATGEFEEASYHEELESIQSHDLTPLLERHHLLLIRSEIAPRYGIKPFAVTVSWNSLDAMTAREQSELNKLNAETGAILMTSGAIDGSDERQRIINDTDSGYIGLLPMEQLELDLDLDEGMREPQIRSSNIGA